jgi:acetoacetate decarboxylase
MSFRLSNDQLMKLASLGEATFFDAKIAWVFWETEKSVCENLLPPGLSIVDPLAMAFVSEYPKTNFSPPYKESALFLTVQSESGKKGIYCLAMPVTNEVALFAGRDVGYPKKIANIQYAEKGGLITGSVERYGQKFVEISLNKNKTTTIAEDAKLLEYISPKGGLIFNIINVYTESFMLPEKKAYVVRQRIKAKPDQAVYCDAQIKLNASIYDPWKEIPVKKIIGGMAFQGQTKMLGVDLDHPVDIAKSIMVDFARMNDMHHFIS